MSNAKTTTRSTRSRNAGLAKIHALARELELGEDAYRAVLYCLTDKRSAGDMNADELATVAAFFAERVRERRAAEVVTDEEALDILG